MTHNLLRPPPGRMEKRRSAQLLQFGDLPPIVLCGNTIHRDHDGDDDDDINGGHHKKKNAMMQQFEFGGGDGEGSSAYDDDHLKDAIKEHEDRLMAARGTTRLVGNRRRRKRRSDSNYYKSSLKQRYEAGDPEVGLLGEASGRGDFEYYVLYSRPAKYDDHHHHQFCPDYLDVAPTGWGDN